MLLSILIISIGCTNNNPPQIAMMELSIAQQQILDLITHTGQEYMFFEFSDGMFTRIEVWVEVYHYGELLGQYGNFTTFSDTPMDAAPIVIAINHLNRNEFHWSLSIGGGRSISAPWVTQSEYLARSFGPIREPVEIVDGKEIILYLSKFTSGTTLSTMNDLQYYLEHPEDLEGYTYVHLIKARFTK